MFADTGVEPRKLHDMRRSAVRNAIRRHVDHDTVKKMSGHLTDDVFSRYNIVAIDDMQVAARRIETAHATQHKDRRFRKRTFGIGADVAVKGSLSSSGRMA